MPTVKTQDGKVLTKDGKVSCECCDADDDPIGCSATSMPARDVVKTITRAQALALKQSGVQCTFTWSIDQWTIDGRDAAFPTFPNIVSCPAIVTGRSSTTAFTNVCEAGSNFGQLFLGNYATGQTNFGGSLRDVLGSTGMSFSLRQLGDSLNVYELGFSINDFLLQVQFSGSSYRVSIVPVTQGAVSNLGGATFSGVCMGSNFSVAKPTFANVFFSTKSIALASGGGMTSADMSITSFAP